MRFKPVAGIVLALAIAGCDETGTQISITRANIRVVHGSPDAPDFDVAVDGRTVVRDLAYTDASDYVQVTPGERTVQVRAASTTTDATSVSINASGDTSYTVIALNRVALIESLVLTDNPTLPPVGNARVRLVHAAPSASTFDIYLTTPTADLATATPTVASLSFRASSTYLPIPAGTYRLRITSAGTKIVALDVPAVPIAGGQIVTALALDAEGGGPPFTLRLLPDASE
ncbi:MAG: DUF4397 domain-containing protein [Longimicrobiales bacterium]